MRDITINEVDVGCDACGAERETRNAATAFVCGVLLGIARDEISFCSRHLAGFKHAMEQGAPERQSNVEDSK